VRLAWALAASIAYVAGGVCMKQSAGLTRLWPSLSLLVLFCAGASMQALSMKNAAMSSTYIFVLGAESVLAFAMGALFFHEAVTPMRIVAVALVTVGIVLLR
jgi:quaternary ammonium compound-resistance protein SugE